MNELERVVVTALGTVERTLQRILMGFDLLHRDETDTIDARNRPDGTNETAIPPIMVEELAGSVKRMEIKKTAPGPARSARPEALGHLQLMDKHWKITCRLEKSQIDSYSQTWEGSEHALGV